MNISQVTKDALKSIAVRVDIESLWNFFLTNKKHFALCSNESFWKMKLKHDFPNSFEKLEKIQKDDPNVKYYDLYFIQFRTNGDKNEYDTYIDLDQFWKDVISNDKNGMYIFFDTYYELVGDLNADECLKIIKPTIHPKMIEHYVNLLKDDDVKEKVKYHPENYYVYYSGAKYLDSDNECTNLNRSIFDVSYVQSMYTNFVSFIIMSGLNCYVQMYNRNIFPGLEKFDQTKNYDPVPATRDIPYDKYEQEHIMDYLNLDNLEKTKLFAKYSSISRFQHLVE
jgi:hypothetical protein